MKIFALRVLLLLIITALFSCNTGQDRYLITASTSQDAIDHAMSILDEGGSAMDAALSVALTEIALTGGKYVSYAGILNLVYFEAETGAIHNMNAAFNTLLNEEDPLTIPASNYMKDAGSNILDGRTILIPGFMKGVEAAHKKFGKIPFANLFEEAIDVAEKGTRWTSIDDQAFKAWKKILSKYPESKAVFTKPDGSDYKIGELFRQPLLAKTLQKVSLEGSDYMYEGEWAQKFVTAARNIGSAITLQDMKDYEVIWSEPARGNYHGYDIYTHGTPAYGGVSLIESLNLAEVSKLSELGHYAKSPEAMSTLVQILKSSLFAFYVPEYFGDEIDLSEESRLKMTTSKLVWDYMLKNIEASRHKDSIYKNDHSAAIVAVDQLGNMVALIHSINTLNWGSNGLFVDGVSIPDPASFQQEIIQGTGPGKRLPDGTNPGIVMKDDQPVLGFSCIGSGLQNQTLTSLINVLDFEMSPKESVETPTVGAFNVIDDTLKLYIEPNKYSNQLIAETQRLGGDIIEDHSVNSGFWTGIYRHPETKNLEATKVWMK